jgi:hypothetical protein
MSMLHTVTQGHMPGEYFHAIEQLAVLQVHDNKGVRSFFTETRIMTLEEFVARVKVGRKNTLYCNFGTLENPDFRLMKGYGKAFLKLMTEILQTALGKNCLLNPMASCNYPEE